MTTIATTPLEAAMEQFNLAPESRPLVRQIALRAGVTGCEVKSAYIKAFRADGLHALHISRGLTEWFGSAEEAIEASGLPGRVHERTKGAGAANWGVQHPRAGGAADTSVRAGAAARAAEPRDYGVCGSCWQARTPSGSCGCDH